MRGQLAPLLKYIGPDVCVSGGAALKNLQFVRAQTPLPIGCMAQCGYTESQAYLTKIRGMSFKAPTSKFMLF